jgi:hypothetical protein
MTVARVVDGETYADSTYMNTLVDAINTNDVRFTGVYNPLDYGAAGDGTTDDTEAILACVADAETNNGSLYFPPLVFGISSEIEIVARDVRGSGGIPRAHTEAGSAGTVFKALHADACLTFTCSYSTVGGFSFDGEGIATRGIQLYGSSGGFFYNLHGGWCAGNGVEIVEMQNAVCSQITASDNGGHGIAVLGGVGEVQFHGVQTNHNLKNQILISAVGDLPGGNDQAHVHFIGGLTEGCQTYDSGTATGGSSSTLVDSTATWSVNDLAGAWVTMDDGGADQEGRRIVSNTATTITVTPNWTLAPTTEDYLIGFPAFTVSAGDNIGFYQTAHTSPVGEAPVLDIWRDAAGGESRVVLTDVKFVTDPDRTIGVAIEGVNTSLLTRNFVVIAGLEGIRIIGTSAIVGGEMPDIRSTTPIVLQSSASFGNQVASLRYGMKRSNYMISSSHAVEVVQVDGENGARYELEGTGKLKWFDGTSYAYDTALYRGGVNTLTTDGKFQVAGTWELPMLFGNTSLWVDGTGDLRIKGGAPSSDLDGTVVGTQS